MNSLNITLSTAQKINLLQLAAAHGSNANGVQELFSKFGSAVILRGSEGNVWGYAKNYNTKVDVMVSIFVHYKSIGIDGKASIPDTYNKMGDDNQKNFHLLCNIIRTMSTS